MEQEGPRSLGVEASENSRIESAVSVSIPQGADWLLYAGIAIAALLQGLLGQYNTDADTAAYLDLSDAIRFHDWHHAINANWFPIFPALIAAGRACFGFRPQYDLLAARLVNAADGLFFVVAAVALSVSLRRLIVQQSGDAGLLPPRLLMLWTAIVTFFFVSTDLTAIKPDALVSAFMLLSVAAVLRALATDRLRWYGMAGVAGGFAYWTKAFAFPFFAGLMLLTAAAHLRKPRVLLRLGLPCLLFALLAGPLIVEISALRGRLTIGEAGRLDAAWYVNRADRFNPVEDRSLWNPGHARANLKHPGELLARDPEIVYFGGAGSFGSTPQWTDLSYWSDGLEPRLVFSDTMAEIKTGLIYLGGLLPMRMQALVLLAALGAWGFLPRRGPFVAPMLGAIFLLAAGSVGLYLLVYLEARYIVFAVVLVLTAAAACARTRGRGDSPRSLHATLLLMGWLVVISACQRYLHDWKHMREQGADPLHGIYSLPVSSAGAQLATLFPAGAEIGCVGDEACFGDTIWARAGRVRMTAIIETGRGDRYLRDLKDADEGCRKLEANPAAIAALRRRSIVGVVGYFSREQACSAAWKPLGVAGGYYLLPLQDGGGADAAKSTSR
jgi:hypothetical protein